MVTLRSGKSTDPPAEQDARQRIKEALKPFRCTATTRRGEQCANPVAYQGGRCPVHSDLDDMDKEEDKEEDKQKIKEKIHEHLKQTTKFIEICEKKESFRKLLEQGKSKATELQQHITDCVQKKVCPRCGQSDVTIPESGGYVRCENCFLYCEKGVTKWKNKD